MISKQKQKKKALTLGQKLEIINAMNVDKTCTHSELAAQYGCGRTTITELNKPEIQEKIKKAAAECGLNAKK